LNPNKIQLTEKIRFANNGSFQENPCPETQTLHENLPRLWSPKRHQRNKMQKMQKQESAMEEKGSYPLKLSEITKNQNSIHVLI
jgi:hypothetical protein